MSTGVFRRRFEHLLHVRRPWVPTAAAGGTQFNQAVAGTLNSSAVLVNQAGKVLAGTLTSSGALLKLTARALLATLTTGGVLTSIKTVLKDLGTNTLATAGALLKRAQLVKAGTLATAGALLKLTSKTFAGTLTTGGVLTSIKTFLKDLGANALTTAGALLKRTNKPLAATVTSAGTLLKQTNKFFLGTLTSAGAFTKLKLVFKDLGANTLTSAGALLKRTNKALVGTVTPIGLLVKLIPKSLAGVLTFTGTAIGQFVAVVLYPLVNLMKFVLHMTQRRSSEVHVSTVVDKDVHAPVRSHHDTEV